MHNLIILLTKIAGVICEIVKHHLDTKKNAQAAEHTAAVRSDPGVAWLSKFGGKTHPAESPPNPERNNQP